MHLDTPENYTNNLTPPTRQRHREERLPNDQETHRNNGNIPHGLSPVREYVPGGAEGGETSSSVSNQDGEETLEEELENFFSNPSYRTRGPPPLIPIDSDEDWRDTSPVPLPSQTP